MRESNGIATINRLPGIAKEPNAIRRAITRRYLRYAQHMHNVVHNHYKNTCKRRRPSLSGFPDRLSLPFVEAIASGFRLPLFLRRAQVIATPVMRV
jgi:hypothetical protein